MACLALSRQDMGKDGRRVHSSDWRKKRLRVASISVRTPGCGTSYELAGLLRETRSFNELELNKWRQICAKWTEAPVSLATLNEMWEPPPLWPGIPRILL